MSDVLIFDRNHNKHYLKIDNCLSLAYSLNQVVNYYENLNIECVSFDDKDKITLIKAAIKNNVSFLDDNGELLYKFDI